jgi:hypothetical protein
MLRTVILTFLSIGLTVAARADTETRTRVTIKGTGNDISIERTEALTTPAKKPELSRSAAASSVLSEALRMKQAGSTDDALVRYLRTHASELPVVVDLDTVSRLRTAGAGKSVIAYLASVAAIEIGDSGAAGGGPVVEYTSSPEPEYESGFAAQYGYPIFGGSSAPAGSGRFGLRSFRRPRPMHVQQVPTLIRPTSPIRHVQSRFLFPH